MISILMPVFNAANWLRVCLDSILVQDMEDWELICVDDYSEDASPSILHEYAFRDARIRVLSNVGQKGILPALQLAYEHSSGGWITRMDADDRMVPDKLSALLSVCRGKGIVATGLVKYFSDGVLGGGYLKYERWLNDVLLSGNPMAHIYEECVIPSPCWMLSRSDFDACGGWKNGRYPEDYDLCFRFFESGFRVVVVPKILHWWRDHPARSSRNDAVYYDQNFFKLKLYYFIKQELDTGTILIVWGAGKKAKILTTELLSMGMTFLWTCNNPSKWGHIINGVMIAPPESIITKGKSVKVLIAVSAKGETYEDVYNRFGKDYCVKLYAT
jgi:glycosyltransferase involved in cell wall biosynthesis